MLKGKYQRNVGILCLLLLFLYPADAQQRQLQETKQSLYNAKDSQQYVDLLNRTAFLFHLSDPDSIFSFARRAKATAVRIRYEKGEADAMVNLATAFYLKGIYPESLEYFTNALDRYRGLGDSAGSSQMLMDLGVVYNTMGDTSTGDNYAGQSLSALKGHEQDSIASMLYLNYAYLKSSLSRDSVRFFADKAVSIASRFQDTRAIVFNNQLRIEKLASTMAAKDSLLNEALALVQQQDWEYYALELQFLRGQLLQASNAWKEAATVYQQMAKTAEEFGYPYFLTDIYRELMKCYESIGDERLQFATSLQLVRSLEREIDAAKQFVVDYTRLTEQEQENQQLLQENTTTKKGTLFLASFAVVALILIGCLLYLYSRVKQSRQELRVSNNLIMEQNNQLSKAATFKRKLVSVLAHDFRKPLQHIQSLHMVAQQGLVTEKELREMLALTEKDAGEILGIFENLLRWIKLQFEGYRPQPQWCEMDKLFAEAIDFFRADISAKALQINIEANGNTSFLSDKETLQFVNRNLIQNAIRFSPAKGTIILSGYLENEQLCMQVRDEGPGIPTDKIDQILNNDGPAFLHKDGYGAGIALRLCQDLLQQAGGTINMENRPPSGTSFFYTLPVGLEER